tara:strand:+ start:104 stop:424 length:321 start_codon:yes stop_codon:yes gene_type:complete
MRIEKTVFKMYIKEGCPFCTQARDYILNDLRASLHTIDITDQRDLHELIIADTGHKTVPAVFMGDEFIGGCDDLLKYGESVIGLVKLLREEVIILREETDRLRRSI